MFQTTLRRRHVAAAVLATAALVAVPVVVMARDDTPRTRAADRAATPPQTPSQTGGADPRLAPHRHAGAVVPAGTVPRCDPRRLADESARRAQGRHAPAGARGRALLRRAGHAAVRRRAVPDDGHPRPPGGVVDRSGVRRDPRPAAVRRRPGGAPVPHPDPPCRGRLPGAGRRRHHLAAPPPASGVERPGGADGRPDLRDRRRRSPGRQLVGGRPGRERRTPHRDRRRVAARSPARPCDPGARTRASRPVVRSMCVFAADGCASGIPDDFPLAAGYPDDDEAEPGPGYGRHGPSRALAPTSFTACGRRLPPAAHDDRLLARWTNVEDFRAPAADHLPRRRPGRRQRRRPHRLLPRVPVEDESDDYVQLTDVRRTAYGDESWAVVRRVELGGVSRRRPHGPAHRPRRTSGPRRHRLQRGRRRPRPGRRHPPPDRRAGPSLRHRRRRHVPLHRSRLRLSHRPARVSKLTGGGRELRRYSGSVVRLSTIDSRSSRDAEP